MTKSGFYRTTSDDQLSGWIKWKWTMRVAQSCPTLCNPMDYTVHGILQARILEWVAFPFSRGSSQPRDLPRSPTLLVDYLPAEPQGIEKKLQSTFQSQSCTQKTSWSLFGCLLLVWSTIAFWILVKLLQRRSMISKLMRCTKNCNTCNQHWSTERAKFFSIATPDHTSHNQCFKTWMNWDTKFCLICHIHLTNLSPANYYFFKHLKNFLQGKCFHNQQDAENTSSNPKAWIFMLQE